MTRTRPLLAVERLGVELGHRLIVDAVEFSVRAGEFVGLLGPNGAGKSTVMKAAAGLLPVRSGQVRILGADAAGLTARRRAQLLAMVPQSTDLDFSFSVGDIVAMGRHPHVGRFRAETAQDHRIVREALAEVGMDDFAGREIGSLSGGERQLVFLAKSIAQQPQVLLLDEPTSALDIRHQFATLSLVGELARRGHAVLAALHDLDLAARHCDRLLVMHRGRLVADGTPGEVVTPELLAQVYGVRADVTHSPLTERPSVTTLGLLDLDDSHPERTSR